MKLAKNRETGQILIWALILLAMGPLLVVPMLKLSYSSQRYNQMTEIYTLNTYAADSGIEYAKHQIYNYPAEIITSSLAENLVIGGVNVYVTVDYNLSTAAYDITSTAEKAGRSLTIDCTIVIDVGLFGNVVACDGDLVIDNCNFVSDSPGEADIYTHGDIEIKGDSYVDGDAKASGTVAVVNSTVTGDIIATNYPPYEGAEVLQFPAIDPELHEDKAKDGGTHNGNLTYDSGGPYDLGPLYVNGKLDINNCDIVLHGTIYVTGDVSIDNVDITGFGDILAGGKLDMNNYSLNVDIPEILPLFMSVYDSIAIRNDRGDGTFAILYAPDANDGTIDLENLELTGSVAARLVTCKSSIIHYPALLRGRADLPGAGLGTVTYTFN